MSAGEAVARLAESGEEWAIVIAGPNPSGQKKARRECDEALEVGITPVCIGSVDGSEADWIVVDPLEHGWWRKLLADRAPANPVAKLIWNRVLRRTSSLFAPLVFWLAGRKAITEFQALQPPRVIVFCDEAAITTAWHCARRWGSSPVVDKVGRLR